MPLLSMTKGSKIEMLQCEGAQVVLSLLLLSPTLQVVQQSQIDPNSCSGPAFCGNVKIKMTTPIGLQALSPPMVYVG